MNYQAKVHYQEKNETKEDLLKIRTINVRARAPGAHKTGRGETPIVRIRRRPEGKKKIQKEKKEVSKKKSGTGGAYPFWGLALERLLNRRDL